MKEKTKEHYIYLDMIRILASFSVVVMHCTDRVFIVGNDIRWWTSIFLQAISHWAIPGFFMLSGITLLEYRLRYNTRTFFKKRATHVLLPFFLWSIFYLLWRMYLGDVKITSLQSFINLFTNNEINGVFWFFYALFGIYLSIPILSLVLNTENRKIAYYFIAVWTGNVVLIPTLGRFCGIYFLEGVGGITVGVATGYVGYLVLGWCIHHTSFSLIQRKFIYILGILGLLIMTIGTYCINPDPNDFDDFLMGYLSIDCIIISVAVIVFLKSLPWDSWIPNGGKLHVIIHHLSSVSFSIYLLQMFVRDIFYRIFPVDPYSIPYMLIAPIVIYLTCLSIAIIGRKVPIIKVLFP
ncbi:acyltransferase [Lachnospiraceae bacterium LCP25S3_G4]